MLTGQLPFRANDRDTLLEMQRSGLVQRPTLIKPDVHPVSEQICLRLLEKDMRKRYQDAHHLQEELKGLQRSLPSQAWEVGGGDAMPAPPPPPPPQSAGVIEWASRAALFSRMVSRAYPSGNAPPEIVQAAAQAWDLASRANKLEGEVASHTRKLEQLERRGRALRAEIGRKVEELAQEESRALREVSQGQDEVENLRGELGGLEKSAHHAQALADSAERQGAGTRQVYEKAGAANALVQAKKDQIARIDGKRAARDAVARDLRRQIEQLRAQLARYAEALEEDLASRREKVGVRAREGVSLEKTFSDVTNVLLQHLKGKQECRDLLNELLVSLGLPASPSSTTTGPQKPSLPGGTLCTDIHDERGRRVRGARALRLRTASRAVDPEAVRLGISM
jgi:serine/threonine-protein kinase